jgi:hypothetical protein
MSFDNNVSEFPRMSSQGKAIALEDMIRAMTDWRNNKGMRNEQIPDELWKNIFTLLNQFSVQTLCATLGISKMQFQRKLDEHTSHVVTQNQQTSKPPMDFCEAREAPPSSSYKPARIPATNTLVVEFCRADGRIMKIHTTTDSFAELMKAFFGGG